MSPSQDSSDGPPTKGEVGKGAKTPTGGTPVAVDVSRDRRARSMFVMFLGGPVVWFAHFMVVYLAVETGCTGEGPGFRLFNPPVPTIVTLAATALATIACVGFAGWGYRQWRARTPDDAEGSSGQDGGDPRRALGFAGFLLSWLSVLAVLIVGLPALVLPACT